jgi:hypothetical protein
MDKDSYSGLSESSTWILLTIVESERRRPRNICACYLSIATAADAPAEVLDCRPLEASNYCTSCVRPQSPDPRHINGEPTTGKFDFVVGNETSMKPHSKSSGT